MEDKKFNPVGWFEIPVNDLGRSEKFYNQVFGYELSRQEESSGVTMSWFPMQMDAIGAAGTLIKGENMKPSPDGVRVYFSVMDIPATLLKVTEAGGTVTLEKTSIGEHGFIGMFMDTEGNLISVHSLK